MSRRWWHSGAVAAAAADRAIGSIACGVLRKVDGQRFPLMSEQMGKVKLREIRIVVADMVEITADFLLSPW
jgi:hypothetical protein